MKKIQDFIGDTFSMHISGIVFYDNYNDKYLKSFQPENKYFYIWSHMCKISPEKSR